MKTSQSKSLSEAIAKYPSLKQTITLANKCNIKIKYHVVKLTAKGKAYQHWLFVESEDGEMIPWTNQNLLGFLQSIKHLIK